MRFFFYALAALLAIPASAQQLQLSQQASQTILTKGTQKQEQAKQDLLWKKLEASIQAADKNLDAVMGVAILDLTSGQIIAYNADEIFPTASVIKIAILAELYHQQEQGKLKLSDMYTVNAADLVPGSDIMIGLTPGVTKLTLRDLATMMMVVSDDAATNVLIQRLGLENITAFAASVGCNNILLRRKMLDLQAAKEGRENLATPRDLVRFLEVMYKGQVLTKTSTEDYLKIFSFHKECFMAPLLPDDVVLATKPGVLEGVRAEAGIIYAQNRPFAIAVMTAYNRNERAAERTIAEIALAAYQHFERIGRSTQYGRVISPK